MNQRQRRLRLPFPLPRTHCGVALGNGNFGALIWGDKNLCITVNRADFWDHRGGERLLEGPDFQKLKAAYDPANPSKLESLFLREERPRDVMHSMRLPVGRFEFTLRDGWTLKAAALEMECGSICPAQDAGSTATRFRKPAG